jgi:hypothetical protein
MATLTALTNRLLIAGGFAVAIAAAPVMVTLATPTGTIGNAVADCPSTEILDPAPPTQNPINPENTTLQPGSLTEGTGTGSVGELPTVDGIPCNGGNTGQCIGLEASQGANKVQLPSVPIGVTP